MARSSSEQLDVLVPGRVALNAARRLRVLPPPPSPFVVTSMRERRLLLSAIRQALYETAAMERDVGARLRWEARDHMRRAADLRAESQAIRAAIRRTGTSSWPEREAARDLLAVATRRLGRAARGESVRTGRPAALLELIASDARERPRVVRPFHRLGIV